MGRRANGEGTLTKRKDGRWQASGYVLARDGGQKRVHFYATSRAEASRKLLAALENFRRQMPVSDAKLTVGEYLETWLTTVVPAKTRPGTARHYETAVRLHIQPFIGRHSLAKLSVREAQELMNVLYANGRTPRTLRHVRTVLSSALGRAQKEELVYRNVARLVDLPHYERKQITPWTVDEARRFLDETRSHRWNIGFHFLLTYGMRRGEVLGLQWGDIDFERDIIHVRRQVQRIGLKLDIGPVKTSAGRRDLPLLPQIREDLLTLHETRSPAEDDHILISKNGTPVEPKSFVRRFLELGAAAGLPRIAMHHTRHTAATLLKNLGVPVRDVQLILGHADAATTQQIYQHGDVSAQRAALERVDEALLPAVHEKAPTASDRHQCADNCCQNGCQDGADNNLPELQGTKNRRSTGVDAAVFVGTPGTIRTYDPLFRRVLGATLSDLPTPVITALHSRSLWRTFGSVAVKTVVKPSCRSPRITNAGRPTAQHQLAIRRACDDALIAKLSKASFPQSLLPTAPLDHEKKESVDERP